MITGLIFAFTGTTSTWFTMTPKAPYLQLVSMIIAGFGLQGCWLMITTMTADVCDEDELKTGLRREGLYGSVVSFTLKAAFAICSITGGFVLALAGYNTDVANETGVVAGSVIFKMRLLLVLIQGMPLIFAAVLFCFYPITRQRAEETRRFFDKRGEKAEI